MNICIFGASSNEISEIYVREVFLLGSQIAERGHSLIFGGGAGGLMGAAVKGVQAKGGYSLGVAPDFLTNRAYYMIAATNSYLPTLCASANRSWKSAPTLSSQSPEE